MFFGGDDDDGDFLTPSDGSSRLGSIFGMDQGTSQSGNQSLTYTAPKQPKKASKGSDQPNAPQVLFAVAAQTYKFVNGKYAQQGKLGAAVLGNHTAHEYRILLYVGKQKQVATAKITTSFNFLLQPNNYATFYDDQRQNWSMMFDTEQNITDFSKQIALSKVNSTGGNIDNVVHQDLVLGEGQCLESGDSAEVKYTGWLYNNNTLGKVFDSNVNSDKAFRFKLGKGKVIKGWEEGVTGMKKGGKRLIIVPPSKAYGSKGMGDRVPPNATLIFEIEIKKVKFSKPKEDQSSSTSSSVVGTPTPDDSNKGDSSSDETVRSRTQSLNEQITTNPTQTKAQLISRMAKMGQPMLPMMGGSPAEPDSTDSEIEDPNAASHDGRPQLSPKPDHTKQQPHQQHQHQHPQTHPQQQQQQPHPQTHPQTQTQQQPPQQLHQQPQAMPSTIPMQQPGQSSAFTQPGMQPVHMAQAPNQQQISLYQPPQQIPVQPQTIPLQQQSPFPQYAGMAPTTQMYPGQLPGQQMPGQQIPAVSQYGAMYPQAPPQQTSVSDMTTPVLLSETRQQQTEIRLAIGKVIDKVDTLSSKIDHMHVQSSQTLSLPGQQTNMESGVLMQNIQRIIQENDRLRKECFEKSSRIESQNEKISDLLQRNQHFVEQSNVMLEQRNDSFKHTTAQSQARVLELEQEKVNLTTELSAATSRISTMQLEIANLKQKESELKLQLQNTMSTSQQSSEEIHDLKSAKFECESRIERLTNSLKEEKLEVKKYKSQLENLEEELTDLRTEKETLEKNLADRKRKAAAEKRKAEEEIEDVKKSYEEELEVLRGKLRHHKTSMDAATAEQVAQAEKEIESQWKERCDRLVAQANEKHRKNYEELKEEKEELAHKLSGVENKLLSLKSAHGVDSKQIDELQEQLEEARDWRNKYENIQRNVSSMKDRYEHRIQELSQSLSASVTATTTVNTEQSASTDGFTREQLIEEVKKIMNNVYYSLRSEFDTEKTYTGSEVLATMMNTIKSVTLKLMEPGSGKEESADEDDEEEESEESDSEEESDDEEDEPEEDKKKEEASLVSRPVDTGPPSSPPPPPASPPTPSGEEEESKPESDTVAYDNKEDETQQQDAGAVGGVDMDGGVAKETSDEAETEDAAEKESPEPEEDAMEETAAVEDEPQQAEGDESQAEGGESQAEEQQEPVQQPIEDVTSQEENNAQLPESEQVSVPESEQISVDLPVVEDTENNIATNKDVNIPAGDDDKIPAGDATEDSVEAVGLGSTDGDAKAKTEEPTEAAAEKKDNLDNIFGDDGDDTAEDLFGSDQPKKEDDEEEKEKKHDSSDEDVTKPRPPPPLFPDEDDDDDDLDWLS